jgi:non-heme chloroperoxidase
MGSAGPNTSSDMTTTQHELQQCERANDTGRQPVVFPRAVAAAQQLGSLGDAVQGRRLHTVLTPGWPDDPDTVAEAKEHPEVFPHESIGQVADHFEEIIRGLDKRRPSSATP